MRRAVLNILLAVLACAANAPAQDLPVDGYAAMVNDRVIMVGDVLNFIQPIEQQLRYNHEGDALRVKLLGAYTNGLGALVERALILEDFEKMEGNVPERLVDDHINSIIRDRFGDNQAEFLRALAEERMTLNEWREQVKEQLIVMLMRRREVAERVSVSPQAVRDAYTGRAAKYTVPEQVKLRMIVLQKGDTEADTTVKRQEAATVLAKLRAGADFGETATSVSEGSKASRGGDWGWTDPTSLRAELSGVATTLQPGETSEVIEAEDAFYILKIEGKKEHTTVPFEEAKTKIEEELRRAEEERLYKTWIDRLREKYYVKIFPLGTE
ncbi:MAG: peptidyl-prolyl cis-trans isomerase [Kiritimatiellae bacterium]|nr:peptidyl-prolyl cis-trans isomerase [Kiritimatiellia bacterium]